MKKVILGGLLSLTATTATANDLYVTFQYSQLNSELSLDDFDLEGVKLEAEPSAISVNAGKLINKNFAIEGLVAVGASDDEVGNFGFDLELSSLIGLYGVGILPLNDRFDLYGKIGLAQVEYEDSDGDNADGAGLSLGFGVTYSINQQFDLNLEFLAYPEAEYEDFPVDIETTAASIGFRINF